jgi:sugar phosphate isomerase/epimerase
MDRRTFLGTVAGAALLNNRAARAFGERTIGNLGVQLYTIRDFMQQDFEGSLAKVSEIDTKKLNWPVSLKLPLAQSLTGLIRLNGSSARFDAMDFTSPSTHVSFDCLNSANFPKVLEASRLIGNRYIVMPWIEEKDRKQSDIWKRASDAFNRAGEACSKAGIQFAYHNHWFEFLPVNGKLPYDFLLESCDPDLVKMQLDLCWIFVAGGDPVKYFNRYPGRFPLVHVKDIKKFPPVAAGGAQNFGDSLADMTDVGSGIIDWPGVLSYWEKAGIRHYIVEHDKPMKPFESITNSYTYLSKLRLPLGP